MAVRKQLHPEHAPQTVVTCSDDPAAVLSTNALCGMPRQDQLDIEGMKMLDHKLLGELSTQKRTG